jgi:hypothetical protein
MMKINWRRLFGLILMDYFSDRGFRVELEKDLSQKRQYLDVVIVERKDEEANLSGICDGFDNLSSHNLLSYKSKRQSLNAWALEELIGHYDSSFGLPVIGSTTLCGCNTERTIL